MSFLGDNDITTLRRYYSGDLYNYEPKKFTLLQKDLTLMWIGLNIWYKHAQILKKKTKPKKSANAATNIQTKVSATKRIFHWKHK